jgi:hypothetical protein
MKKSTITIALSLLSLSCFAQAAYMHEAAEDSSPGGLFDALEGLAGIATIIMFAMLAFVVIFAMIPSKIDDIKFDKKYKKRRKLLEDEASNILAANRFTYPYQKINSNPCFRQWFLDGYVNGVDDGRERKVYKPYSSEYEIISIEEYVRRRGFEHLRQELMGGDVEFSKLSFTEGIKHGATRRETKGDSQDMLD